MGSITNEDNPGMVPRLKHLLLQENTRDPLSGSLVDELAQGSVRGREVMDFLDHVLVGFRTPFGVPEGHVVGLGGGELHLDAPADSLAGNGECAPLIGFEERKR